MRRSKQLPEGAGIERANGQLVLHIEEITIAGDENIGVAGNSRRDDPSIRGVSNGDGRRLLGLGNGRKWCEHRYDSVEAIGWHLELGGQNAPEFREDDLANNEIVFREHGTQHIGAEPARGEGSDEDVRVETNSHDTARKTSSSVR